ncbi:hypothetical protein SD71_06620 [Cohnella kolymensis]|uniref:SLH domain-containing protein n=1 Tax=Cohnella kolymensis TaxID=1590652 RepID=A0ABR5A8D6_9BACL|nr:S-layer homology domain-containing protein [Cohnella kolymensis]KIL36672.1 hypothetical protein SD71_06620 [Cohnella kolymensis]
MRHMKRPLVWLMLVALIGTLIPAGFTPKANAAGNPATYFIPDSSGIRNTAKLVLDNKTSPDYLTRTTAYTTNNGTLTINGTYSYVSKDSMAVKIEQLNLQSDGSWTPDSTHFTTGTVVEEPGSMNRFSASGLTLFSGMNRITFSGKQGSINRSDVFYVLYDQVPYVQSMQVTSASGTINLNEGTQAVVPSQDITLQGVAKNANKVTVGVNGGSQIIASVLEDGTFFSPSLKLLAGLNTLTITITNGTNTANISRQLYYFDPNNPYTDVQLVQTGGGTHQLVNAIPQLTNSTATPEGKLTVQMLVPSDELSPDFGDNASYTLNGGASTVIPAASVTSETIIPGSDGVTPKYRLVTFTTPNTFQFKSVSGVYDKTQSVSLTVSYTDNTKTFTSTFNGKFMYLPGDTVITKMHYLPGYDGTSSVGTALKEPLNGAEVSSSIFYILVEADQSIGTTTNLSAVYLPLASSVIDLTDVTPAGTPANQKVYKVKDFANGQQKVQFKLGTSSSTYNADITFVSKSYIYVENLYDGQTYSFDSNVTNTITITGQYIGFQNIATGSAQYFINGIAVTTPALSVTTSTPTFNLPLTVGGTSPLVFGENRIVFKGINQNGTGNSQEIIKEIRIYIIDTNVSTITRFHPTLSAATREPFDSAILSQTNYPTSKMAKIFALTPEFLPKDGKYITSETQYDLVLRGGGASFMNLKLGSQTMHRMNLPTTANLPTTGTFDFDFNGDGDDETYTYDFAGDQTEFIFRVREISFAAPGSHIYNLELINSTGAVSNQSLEITRELSPYRILSPQPTVGNQIVVNKNFVRFDIEAEGATEVLIGGKPAVKRADLNDRFVYDYVGLKPDKLTAIKIQIKTAGNTLNDTVNVFYTASVQVDSQYMEKLGPKYAIFNKKLQLTFPKGTVLKSAYPNLNSRRTSKLYNDTMILFGIADPVDGIVEKRNDYGNILGVDKDARTYQGLDSILIPDYLTLRFGNNSNTFNFTRISEVFWISGGAGEFGERGQIGYKPATNGLAPYSNEGNFTEFAAERKVIPSNRGKLTLTYDSNVVEEVGHTVTVFRYTDKGVWENIGGEVNTKSRTITVPFDDFGYYMVVKLRKSFNDVTNHGWARNILNGLYSKGIMKSIRGDEFGANDLTTRGEFATLLVKSLNIPINSEGVQTFFDISPGTASDTWDYEHIETAARAGIVTGLSEGFFGADMRLSRQEAAVMIARALELKIAVNDSKLEASLAKTFADSGSIHYYARPSVDAVNKAKIMTGSAATATGQNKAVLNFNPRGNMTRAEAGKIAVALLQKKTKIFPKNLS